MTQGRPTAAPAIWPYENTPLSATFEWRLPPRPQRVLKHWAPLDKDKPLTDAQRHRAYYTARYERERRSARG